MNTSRLAAPARTPPSMSVSSRSPTTSGCRAPVRATASACSGGSGLPATTGCCPVEATITWHSAPLPGCRPRPVGMVASAFEATYQAPAATASAPSHSSE